MSDIKIGLCLIKIIGLYMCWIAAATLQIVMCASIGNNSRGCFIKYVQLEERIVKLIKCTAQAGSSY